MTKRMSQAIWCVFALSLLLVLPVAGHAQAVFGSINGSVTDPTGAAIPNATITVTDVQKGTSVTTTSNGSGEYTVEHLIVDSYNVRCEAPGFTPFQANGVQVFVDTSPKVVCQLPIGKAAGETVTVSADAIPELKTDRADVATVFDSKDVYGLPVAGRNFTNLQLLLPGAQLLGWSHAADENPQGSAQIQVDGQAFGGVAYELDGTDNQDPILGIIVINPSLDALNEAKITTQNFDAEFGKAVSSVIVASTKSGTNSFHGSAFDFRTSTANDANDAFGGPVIPGLKNIFGGSVGGPILKDKLFFFGDYQGTRQKVATSAQSTIPTKLVFDTCLGNVVGPSGIPGCDFSQYAAAYGSKAFIYNNQPGGGGAQYPGNVIPAAQVNPASKQFLSDMYSYISSNYGNYQSQPFYSSTQDANSLITNFTESGTGGFNADQWDVRVDYQISERIHSFGRFSRFTDTLSGTQLFGPNVGGPGFGIGGYGGVSTGANDSFAGGADVQLSPKWLTDFRLGYYRYNIGDSKNNQTVDYFSQIGIPGENVGGLTGGSGGFALDTYNGNPLPNGGAKAEYGSFLDINRCNCPLTEREDQFQGVNNWTRIFGNHALKFGADIRYARNLRVPSDTDRTGINTFATGPTASGSSAGLPFATFALGDVTSYGRYVSVSTNAKEFQKRDFFYIQDTWRATPNLTINYGIRWDLFFPESVNAPGNGSLMNLNDGYLRVAGIGGQPSDMGWSPNWRALSPRIGVAYQLNPKTVIRAGYGRSYDIGVFGSVFGHVVTQNLPVLANQQINTTGGQNSYVFNLSTGPQAFVFPGPCSGTNDTNCIESNGLLPAPGYSVSPKARPDPLRLPLLDAWNLSLQRSITPTLSVTIAYVGNKGTHTLADGDGNNTNPNEPGLFLPAANSINGAALHYDPTNLTGGINGTNGTSNNTFLERYYGGTLAACQDPHYATPVTEPGIVPGMCGWNNGISFYHDSLDTHFNALQVTIAKTISHGISFTSNYQWARAFDFNSSYVTWSKPIVYGRDSNVREQQEVLFGQWNLPVGRGGQYLAGAPTWLDEIIGHWAISGTINWAGGLPYTLTYDECYLSVNCNNGGDAPNYAFSPAHLRVASNLHRTSYNQYSFFTPVGQLASQDPTTGVITYTPKGGFAAPGIDQFGNEGRNTFFGPNYFNTDASVQKNFPIHEALEAQFRVDTFNLFNHINPSTPNSSIESGGTITGEAPSSPVNPTSARYLQFSVRVQF